MTTTHTASAPAPAPTFDSLVLSIPAHWLCPILYGDTTGLDDAEDRAFGRWLTDMLAEFGETHIGTIKNESHFARYHDAADYGVLACDCYDVEFMFRPAECVEHA